MTTTEGPNQFMLIQHPQFFPFLSTFFRKSSNFPYLLPQLVDSTLNVSIVHVFYIPNDRDHKTLGRSKVPDQLIHRGATQTTALGRSLASAQKHSCLLLCTQQVGGGAALHPGSWPGNWA